MIKMKESKIKTDFNAIFSEVKNMSMKNLSKAKHSERRNTTGHSV